MEPPNLEAEAVNLFSLAPIFLLLLLNALFVAAEFALVRSMPAKLKSPEMQGKFGVGPAIKLLDSMDIAVSVTQLGITVVSLLLGWLGEKTFHAYFASIINFASVQFNFSSIYTAAISSVLAISLVTVLHVIFGELIAKAIAIRFPESVLRFLSPPLTLVATAASPIVTILNIFATWCLRLLRIKDNIELDRAHSSGELAMLVSHSKEKGMLDKDEEEMLHGVFNFSETVARQVMTPRTELVTIDMTATLPEVLHIVSESGFSRFPVVNGSVDKIVGVLLSRDLITFLDAWPTGERTVPNPEKVKQIKEFSVDKVMRETYFIPGTKSINDLLKDFKKAKLHMAIVVDEHGGIAGVVTLEDLIEEIVGDIFDESDNVEEEVSYSTEGDAIIDASMLIENANEEFQLGIPDGEYDTVGGFILSVLGRMPKVGDEIGITKSGIGVAGIDNDNSTAVGTEHDDEAVFLNDFTTIKTKLKIEKIDGMRIDTVKIMPIENDAQKDIAMGE